MTTLKREFFDAIYRGEVLDEKEHKIHHDGLVGILRDLPEMADGSGGNWRG